VNCRKASRLVSDELDRSLPWYRRLPLRLHLLLCSPCRRFRRAAGWLHEALRATRGADVRLRPQARDRIRRALERAAREENE
jgi:hypothetical protein